MSRIRTVKPELFKHEALFIAENTTNLPLRLVFIGLFTCCDREGRFRWQPQRLKLDLLPYDQIDLAPSLNALLEHGFIEKYEHQGNWYGCIPSWLKHQYVNHREVASDIPASATSVQVKSSVINKNTVINNITEWSKANPCMPGHARGEYGIGKGNMEYEAGKGNVEYSDYNRNMEQEREGELNLNSGKDKGGKGNRNGSVKNVEWITNFSGGENIEKIFQYWKLVMGHHSAQLDHKRALLISNALNSGYSVEQLCEAINGCSLTPHNMGDNDSNQRYDGLHIILRDADQIDRFVWNYNHPPKLSRAADQHIRGNAAVMQQWLKKKMQEGNQ